MKFYSFSAFLAISAHLQAAFANELSITPKNDTIVWWTSNDATRGTWDIISSCSFVIILCTWNVLHCNVPAPSESSLSRILRLVKYTLITVFVPEAMFVFAMIELQTARRDSKLLEKWYAESYEEREEKIYSKGKGKKANSKEIYPVEREEPDFTKVAQMIAAHWMVTLKWLGLLNPPKSLHAEEGLVHIKNLGHKFWTLQ